MSSRDMRTKSLLRLNSAIRRSLDSGNERDIQILNNGAVAIVVTIVVNVHYRYNTYKDGRAVYEMI